MKFFSFVKNHPIIAGCFLFVFLIVISFGLRIKSGKAIGLPFGGQIMAVTYCIDQTNFVVTVGPPVGGQFTYAGGMLYSFYQIFRPGPWVLGTYTPGSVGCTWTICTSHGCYVVILSSPVGVINEVGTSM